MLDFEHIFLLFRSIVFFYLLIHIYFGSFVPLLIFSLFLFHLFSVKFNFVRLARGIRLVWEVQFHVQESQLFLSHLIDFLPDDVASVIFSDCIDSVISIYLLLIFIPSEIFLPSSLLNFLLTRILGFLRNFNSNSTSFIHLDNSNGGLKILDDRD